MTELEVWNAVLDGLSQSAVVTVDQKTNLSSADARWFNRNYERTVKSLLRANVWTFAKDLQTLTADGTPPDFDYTYRFKMPSTWLRLLPVTSDGAMRGGLTHYEMVGRFIHCDEPGPLPVRGIDYKEDPADWDALFIDVVVARLMQQYALKLTGKTNYKQIAKEEFDQAFNAAMAVGAIEEFQDPIEAHDIIRVRS